MAGDASGMPPGNRDFEERKVPQPPAPFAQKKLEPLRQSLIGEKHIGNSLEVAVACAIA